MTKDDGAPEISRLRSLAHPLRLRMMSLLTADAMSAAEVARELDISHANASYHLRFLLDAHLIVVEGEERIRGGMAKRYRYPVDRDEPRPSDEDLAGYVEGMCHELRRRFGSVQRDLPAAYTDAELWVTPETWREVSDSLRRASHLLHERAERPRTEGTVPVNLTVAAFGMRA